VATGFVEQGLWSIAFHPKFKDNSHVFVHYASLPFNGASLVMRFTVDKASPNMISKQQLLKSAKGIMNIPQPYYNHYGGMITFGRNGTQVQWRSEHVADVFDSSIPTGNLALPNWLRSDFVVNQRWGTHWRTQLAVDNMFDRRLEAYVWADRAGRRVRLMVQFEL